MRTGTTVQNSAQKKNVGTQVSEKRDTREDERTRKERRKNEQGEMTNQSRCVRHVLTSKLVFRCSLKEERLRKKRATEEKTSKKKKRATAEKKEQRKRRNEQQR